MEREREGHDMTKDISLNVTIRLPGTGAVGTLKDFTAFWDARRLHHVVSGGPGDGIVVLDLSCAVTH